MKSLEEQLVGSMDSSVLLITIDESNMELIP